MSNNLSNQAESTGQPFRLLDLPRELLVPIVRSYRTPIDDDDAGVFIYQGEEDEDRYRVLLDLCLAHRDILPFAQEELFNRLDIRDDDTTDLLNETIASSERCKGYAGRAESIFLGEHVDPDGLMESGVFNTRELSSDIAMKLSLLNRFRNLRRIHLIEAQLDEALVLPNLETYHVKRAVRINMDTSADFKSANLPNLRRLTIAHGVRAGSVGQLYDSILPQLNHLTLSSLCVADFEHLLPLTTLLQSLRIAFKNYNERLAKVLKQVSRVDVKDLLLFHGTQREYSDNWETDFELIEEFKKLVERKEGLIRVKLDLHFRYRDRPSEDVSTRFLARWKGIKGEKGELESICVKKGIVVERLTCSLSHPKGMIWIA